MFCLYSIHTTRMRLWGQGTLMTGYFEVGRLWEQDGWGERWRVANNRMPSSYSCSQNNVIYLLIVCTVILSFIVGLYYSLLVNRCSLLVFQKCWNSSWGQRAGSLTLYCYWWTLTWCAFWSHYEQRSSGTMRNWLLKQELDYSYSSALAYCALIRVSLRLVHQ